MKKKATEQREARKDLPVKKRFWDEINMTTQTMFGKRWKVRNVKDRVWREVYDPEQETAHFFSNSFSMDRIHEFYLKSRLQP